MRALRQPAGQQVLPELPGLKEPERAECRLGMLFGRQVEAWEFGRVGEFVKDWELGLRVKQVVFAFAGFPERGTTSRMDYMHLLAAVVLAFLDLYLVKRNLNE